MPNLITVPTYMESGDDIQKYKIKKDKKPSRLSIGYEKTCSCPPNHINCLDAKQWMKSQVAEIFSFNMQQSVFQRRPHS